ncbi:MAG: CDP-alcohol phosphatidyltransferase family protein [Anaerolineae bacterium]
MSARREQMEMAGLRRRWTAATFAWVAALLAGYWLLQPVWPYAGRWALMTAVPLAYGLWVLRRGLPQNRRAGRAALLPTLGTGTHLTLWRGLAISMVAGFLFSPRPAGGLAWLPAMLYTTASIADYLDGYLARITRHDTALGATLDMEFDSLGMLVVTLLAVWYGQLPWWYLGLGLARYFFLFGIWWRRRRGRAVHDLSPSVHRRIFAGFQMGFMSVVLWPILPPGGTAVAGTAFALPTALGFLRDWLVTAGRMDPAAPTYRTTMRRLYRAATRWLPLCLRLSAVIGLALVLRPLLSLHSPIPWETVLAGWRLPWPRPLSMAMLGIAVLAGIAVAVGAAGRIASLLLVLPISLDIIARGLGWANGAALVSVIWLMMWGTGAFSTWQPEEPYMVRRAGERAPMTNE